jgi:multiple sugar transport system ATP-binding protein
VVVSAEGRGARVRLGDGVLDIAGMTAKPGDRITVGIRPEHFSVGQAEGQTLFTSEVALVERLGGETLVYVKPQTGADLLVIKTTGKTKLKPGERIPLTATPENMHFFAADGVRLS